MAKRANLYLGGAGQHAVVSEFLVRGWNVAIPEIDVGDDLFVVRDRDGKLHRIQVKTATAQERNYGYNARFNVPLSQLSQVIEPELTYVFVVRFQKRWDTFLLVERADLYREHLEHNIGSKAGKTLVLNFRYFQEDVKCSDRDFSTYLDNWSTWPVIEH
jgi:hypothetical protein